jgi:hypothetical protein
MYMYEPGELERKRQRSNKRLVIAMLIFSVLIIVPTMLSNFEYDVKMAVLAGTLLCLAVVLIAAKFESMTGEKHAEN